MFYYSETFCTSNVNVWDKGIVRKDFVTSSHYNVTAKNLISLWDSWHLYCTMILHSLSGISFTSMNFIHKT